MTSSDHPTHAREKAVQAGPDEPTHSLRELPYYGDVTMMLSIPIALKAHGIDYVEFDETRFRTVSQILVKEADYDRAVAVINDLQDTPVFEPGPRHVTILVVGLLVIAFLIFFVAWSGAHW